MEEPILTWFQYDRLLPHSQETAKPFHELAVRIVQTIEPGPERTVALRKLYESKEAAIRATMCPGG